MHKKFCNSTYETEIISIPSKYHKLKLNDKLASVDRHAQLTRCFSRLQDKRPHGQKATDKRPQLPIYASISRSNKQILCVSWVDVIHEHGCIAGWRRWAMTIDHLRTALKSASRYEQEQVCQLKSCSQTAIKNNDLVGCNKNQNDPFLTKSNANSRVNNCEC